VGFSVPDYMDPRSGGPALRLYRRYRDWCATAAAAS
jgi:hypothetical protein